MSEICPVCKQSFREGDPLKPPIMSMRDEAPAHLNASDCIAAAVRRCAEIAKEQRADLERFDEGATMSRLIQLQIRMEFPTAFEDAERLLAEMGK